MFGVASVPGFVHAPVGVSIRSCVLTSRELRQRLGSH
jgi:hypothetical protein